MIALPTGDGDWASMSVADYNPSCSLTLFLNKRNEEFFNATTLQEMSAFFGIGGRTWRARLVAGWQHDVAFAWWIYLSTAGFSTSDSASSTTPPFPDFIEFDFAVSFVDIESIKRNSYTPSRGGYVQNADEITAEQQWFIDAAVVSTEASFGSLDHTLAAGDAFAADQQTTGATLTFDYTHDTGTSSDPDNYGTGTFADILIDGEPADCSALSETYAVGDGNNIYCGIANPPDLPGDWTGWIRPPIQVTYTGDVVRNMTDAEPTAKVVDLLKCKQDAVDYVLAGDLDGYTSPALWQADWGCAPAWATTFFNGGRKVYLYLYDPSPAEDNKIILRDYPLNDVDPASGRVAAVTFAHDGAADLEGGSVSGFRRSDWAATAGSDGVNVENTPDFTSISVDAGASGAATRELVNGWLARVDASGTPWHEMLDLVPHAGEDNWHGDNYGPWLLRLTADWTGGGDKTFWLRINYYTVVVSDTHHPNDVARVWSRVVTEHTSDIQVTVSGSDRGNEVDQVLDVHFPYEELSEPDYTHITDLTWISLDGGDSLQWSLMRKLPEPEDKPDSTRLSLVCPDNATLTPPVGKDFFCCQGNINGKRCFYAAEDHVAQIGVQYGIQHCYYYIEGIVDTSQLRPITDTSGPFGFVEMLNYQEGWSAEALDLGNALEDADGNVLIPPAMFLLEEGFAFEEGSLYLTPRCYSYALPYGGTYTARPEKHIGGAFQGLACMDAHESRAPSGTAVVVLQCEEGTPTSTVAVAAYADKWGRFVAQPLTEYAVETPPIGYYAIHKGVNEACRATVNVEALWVSATTEIQDPFTLHHPSGAAYTFFSTGGSIGVKRSEIEDLPFDPVEWCIEDGISTKPWVAMHRGGYVMARSERPATIVLAHAQDYWTTWRTDQVIYTDALYPAMVSTRDGLWLYVFAYRAGAIVVRRTADWGAALATLPNDVTEATVIASGADQMRCAPWQSRRDGSLYCDVAMSGVIRRFRSDDSGGTWTELT